jgi:hypothetical protein
MIGSVPIVAPVATLDSVPTVARAVATDAGDAVASLEAQGQSGGRQTGAGQAPFEKDVSAEEKTAELRLLDRRKRRHEEAFVGAQSQRARTDALFPAVSSQVYIDDGTGPSRARDTLPSTLAQQKPYSKFVKPAGNLTRDQLKDLVERLNLPLQKQYALLVDVFYRHYLNSATPEPPKLPLSSPIYQSLVTFWNNIPKNKEEGTVYKLKQAPNMLQILYKAFRTMMNDSSTYDTPLMAARNRVQYPPHETGKWTGLDIPKTNSHPAELLPGKAPDLGQLPS